MVTGMDFTGMHAGEQPRMEVTFMHCTNGCEQRPEVILEWFGDPVS
jgi:hypothetical protein